MRRSIMKLRKLSCFKFTESLRLLRADNLNKMKQGSEPHTDRKFALNLRDAMTLVHVTGQGYKSVV